jgi:hypothetical protein
VSLTSWFSPPVPEPPTQAQMDAHAEAVKDYTRDPVGFISDLMLLNEKQHTIAGVAPRLKLAAGAFNRSAKAPEWLAVPAGSTSGKVPKKRASA